METKTEAPPAQEPEAAPHAAATPATAPPPARPPSRRGRWLGALVAVLLLAGVGAAAWYLIHRPAATGPGGGGGMGGARVTVGEAVVRAADVPVYLDALGTATPVATVTLRPQVSGVLTEVHFKEGQMVTKGQLMAQIDPRPFQQALMQAQGTRQRDEAQLENARITLQRYQILLGQDSIARQDVDTQAALVRQLEGTATTDRAAEKTAQLNLDFTRVVAPVAGRVGLRVVDAGNVVSSSDTAGIAVITQVNPIDVEFAVPQDRVPEVAEQQATNRLPVTALDRTRAKVLDKGQFLTLDNQVDVQTGTVRAKARFRNADNTLFPNQFVNVRLLLRTIEGALVVPVTALRTGPKGDFVYVINEDRTVSMREVKRGQASVDTVVISSGLQKDERVVTEGGDRLQDGASVRLATDAPRSGASAPPPAAKPLPTAEQRQRMLDAVKDDPEQLERRKKFLEALDKGDAAALERWQRMGERRREGRGAGTGPSP